MRKKLFEYITCQTSPSQWTFPGHLIYNCNLFSTNIPLSRSLIYFLCNACHHSHIMYLNYWPISPNRKQTSWGQGFIFFAHYCISLVLEQCLCLLVIQWIFEECWCRWKMKDPSSLTSMHTACRWVPVLVWAIQSNCDSHVCTGTRSTGRV